MTRPGDSVVVRTDAALQPTSVLVEQVWHSVLGVDDRWHDPSASYLRVRLSDGTRVLLRHDLDTGNWLLLERSVLDA